MILATFALLAPPALAQAAPPSPAEVTRLEDELVKLAQRNTWTGVDRTYRRLLDHGGALPPQDHYLGAQSALSRGDTLLAWYRLRRAERSDPGIDTLQREAQEAATREVTAIGERYGLVSIFVGHGAVPVLYRDAMPFAQQERDAIIAAQRIISEQRTFRGFLPVGSYAIDAVKFDVQSDGQVEGYLVVDAGDR
ncbi:MAG: hypothetical protein R3F59_19405 [Myxococcota bacterium]